MLYPFHHNRSNSDSDDDADTPEQEYPSLDSVPSDNSLQGTNTFSPRNSEPPSLTESMQLMDEILSDKTMDRFERIDKLEAILSAATMLPSESVCFCVDHSFLQLFTVKLSDLAGIIIASTRLSVEYVQLQSYRGNEIEQGELEKVFAFITFIPSISYETSIYLQMLPV